MRKPTLKDVAETAGVSYATADRVLNMRGGVADKSAQRVRAAIATLGYRRDVEAANLARGRTYEFVFLIPGAAGSFFAELENRALREAEFRRHERYNIQVRRIVAFDADALATSLEACVGQGLDGVCLVAAGSPRVTAALDALRSEGVAVVTLVSDLDHTARDTYVGIDNLMAGRTAGRLMKLAHRWHDGLVLPIAGNLRASDHKDRHEGFMEVMTGAATILPVVECFDDAAKVARALDEVLAAHPNLSGIYSVGAGNEGLAQGLRRCGPRRPVTIVHDMLGFSRSGLENGLIDAVIDQKPVEEISRALTAMRLLSDGLPLGATSGEIVPSVHVKDNMPTDTYITNQKAS